MEGTVEGLESKFQRRPNNAEVVARTPGAVYTGLALDSVSGTNYVYAADATGSIQVFDSSFTNVTSTTFAGRFIDQSPVAGFTPYNIQNLRGNLFVTYAAATTAYSEKSFRCRSLATLCFSHWDLAGCRFDCAGGRRNRTYIFIRKSGLTSCAG